LVEVPPIELLFAQFQAPVVLYGLFARRTVHRPLISQTPRHATRKAPASRTLKVSS
jgi:hypothetical protein